MPKLPGVARFVGLVALAGGLFQTPAPPPPPGTGLIFGQVVDPGTGQPIAGAMVTLGGGPILVNGQPLPADDPAMQESLAAARNTPRILTDASGQFVFRDLRKGSYRISASAPGYAVGQFGQHQVGGLGRSIDLDDGEHVGNATIKLWKYATISGRITDDAGEPAVGVTVRALRVQVNARRRTLAGGAQVQTDDRGVYRMYTLAPGDYILAVPQSVTTLPASYVDAYSTLLVGGASTADLLREMTSTGAPFPSLGGMRVGDHVLQQQSGLSVPAPADAGHLLAYQSAFYPAAPTSADAGVLTLASGQDLANIDLQLRLIPTLHVSGVVTGPDGPARNIGVRLVPVTALALELDNGLETATTVSDGNGAFTFLGVPEGQYTLKAQKVPRPQFDQSSTVTVMNSSGGGFVSISSVGGDLTPPPPVPTEPTLFAQSPVPVAGRDVEGLAVQLRPGAQVSGRLVFEGTSAPPPAAALLRVAVSLTNIDGGITINGPRPAPVSADGQFTTQGYPPGRYFVNASGAGLGAWSLRSVTAGGRNLDDAPLDLQTESVSGLVLTFSDRPTAVSGSVRVAGASATADVDATIVAFPSNYAGWIEQGMSGRRTRTASTGKGGGYTIAGLPPGDYVVAAVASEALSTIRDTKFYEALARVGTHVTLADGDRKTLDFTVSPGR
ncbi:MAG TPA: carboxypeptidase-like regulatory domain-containing protein [Vicinamibacterales bacterium]|nr:carboxypeptidase-like regulatory domain-containing protein [Vicinamibacterales bacterium]